MSIPPLSLHLFGPLRVLVHGEPLPRVRTRSVEWLAALLVLRHGRAVSRSWLAGTLWPESEESRALQNLRDDLMRLRKALGPEAVRIQSPARDTLLLDVAGAEVDIVAFDAAVKTGDEASLQRAVAFYTGPLLEGCYEAWVMPERESREQACLLALETLAGCAEQHGDFNTALVLLRRAEGMDSLRDSIQRGLMRVLAAGGDTPAALLAYREHRLRLRREMNVEPDAETTRLFQEIRARAGETARLPLRPRVSPSPDPVASDRLPVRPPHSLAPLIGRGQEVEDIRQRLRQSRLVTLIGAGGVGKTRLAMETAARSEESFPGGVFWVELAPLSEDALILPTIATAAGVRQEGIRDSETLRSRLVATFSEGASLLALDNCEHLLDAAAAVAQSLLARCPDLHILATSRQRLGPAGEVAWRVPSLPAPDPAQLPADLHAGIRAALTFPAIRLFVERAEEARSGFQLRCSDDVSAVCRICRRLDGIPLALELAAARVTILPVAQIASRLDDRFRLLTGGSRTISARHRTLQSLIDWSHDLLTEPERVLLRRLSVFAGGWELEAAEAVFRLESVLPPEEEDAVLDVLASLVDKSLVLVEEHASGLRYRMLETVREYGQTKLRESGETEAVRARHAAHYLALAEQARPFLEKPEPAWLDRLEVEHDNLRAALNYYSAQEKTIEKAVELAAALGQFWNLRGHYHEQRTWLLGPARRPTAPTKARSELLVGAARLIAYDKDFAGAQQMFTESLEIARQLGDRRGIASALNGLAGLISDPRIAGSEYDCIAARALTEESLAIVQELGDKQGMAHTLYLLGHLARKVGDDDEARVRWMECHNLDQDLGNKGGYVLWILGDLALESGDYAAAHRFFERYVTERYEVGDGWSLASGLRALGALALAEGKPERAARLLGASLALRESFRRLSEEERARYGALLSTLRVALGDSIFDTAYAQGRAMTPAQAVAYALKETPGGAGHEEAPV